MGLSFMNTQSPPTKKLPEIPEMRRSLKSLQEANLPRLDWRSLFTIIEGELSAEDTKAMDEYFHQFVETRKGDGCIKCGARQGAKDIVDAFLGNARFTWGLANGEGFCGACKYPARAYHRNVGPIKFFEGILQYHPDELTEKPHRSENGAKSSDAIGASSPNISESQAVKKEEENHG